MKDRLKRIYAKLKKNTKPWEFAAGTMLVSWTVVHGVRGTKVGGVNLFAITATLAVVGLLVYFRRRQKLRKISPQE